MGIYPCSIYAKINNKFMLYLRIAGNYCFCKLGIAILGFLIFPIGLKAQQLPTIFDLLYGEEVLEARLTGDMTRLLSDKHSGEAIEAVFSYTVEGKVVSRPVELSLRGRFRRMTCDFPPLLMQFKKKQLKKEGLAEHNDIKLVTHCLDNAALSKRNLIKEYLAYKVLALLTDHSFRVQLARITYVDSAELLPKTRRYALLIEDEDELAERLGASECGDCLNPDITRMDMQDLALMSVFQYMIGNTDWSVLMNRNVKLFETNTTGQLLSVPYDFDFSGWVNAPYAKPNIDLGQVAVTQRFYVGLALNDTLRRYTFALFEEKRAEIQTLVAGCRKLDAKSRQDLLDYLDSFYEDIRNIDMRFANRAMVW